MIVVELSTALICFLGSCYPALIGNSTPTGTFSILKRITDQAGYGGDVLQFYEDDKNVFAIHRVWLLNAKENRASRIKSSMAADRIITSGCINVSEDTYNKLIECCQGKRVEIKK
jgi:hypothetical protein